MNKQRNKFIGDAIILDQRFSAFLLFYSGTPKTIFHIPGNAH